MVELLNTNEDDSLDDRITTILEEDTDGNTKTVPVEMRVYLPNERVAARVLATGKVIQMHWRAGTERYDTEIDGKIYYTTYKPTGYRKVVTEKGLYDTVDRPTANRPQKMKDNLGS